MERKAWNKIEFTKEQIESIINLYEKDLKNIGDIGDIFNVDGSVISRVLKENGIRTDLSHRRILLCQAGLIVPHNKGKPFLAGEKNPMYGKVHPSKGTKGLWHWSEESKFKQKKPKSEDTKRKMSETRIKKISRGDKDIKIFGDGMNPSFKGENNPRFNNWASREPYGLDFSPELKECIRKRDNFTCQECGKKQIDSKLNIHHINYNKLDNSYFNLIALCNICHGKTNSDRKHWENYFKMKMFVIELFNPENILIWKDNKLIGIK